MERNTIQRRAIHRVFEETRRPLGPPEVFEEARRRAPGLGIATVYRTIKRMVEEGWLLPVELPGEAPRYEVAGTGGNHHFRCRLCNRVYNVPAAAIDLARILPEGFRVEAHQVVLKGQCQSCSA